MTRPGSSSLIAYLALALIAVSCADAASDQTPTRTETAREILDSPTPTPSPTVQVPTSTPSSEPTTTPTNLPVLVATLSQEDAQRYEDLLTGLPDCRLPCWNGLFPGPSEVSADAIRESFARLGADLSTEPPIGGPPGNYGFAWQPLRVDGFNSLSRVSVVWNDQGTEFISLFYYRDFQGFLRPSRLI